MSSTMVRGNPTLIGAAKLLPTPTAARYGNNQSPSPGAAVRPSLDELVKLLPTPCATDAKGTRNATAGRSNPDSAHHSGTTLTDVFWTGLATPLLSTGGNEPSDDEHPPRLF
jgi:DNA (cytosine-5)-methyltransferase 1